MYKSPNDTIRLVFLCVLFFFYKLVIGRKFEKEILCRAILSCSRHGALNSRLCIKSINFDWKSNNAPTPTNIFVKISFDWIIDSMKFFFISNKLNYFTHHFIDCYSAPVRSLCFDGYYPFDRSTYENCDQFEIIFMIFSWAKSSQSPGSHTKKNIQLILMSWEKNRKSIVFEWICVPIRIPTNFSRFLKKKTNGWTVRLVNNDRRT